MVRESNILSAFNEFELGRLGLKSSFGSVAIISTIAMFSIASNELKIIILRIISASPGSDVDLTSIIQLGNGVSMGKNEDSNFPVFNFDTGHNVVENALDVFENSLPSEFSIQVHLK